MKHSTLLFLVKKNDGKVTDICLAMKKRGFGTGRWNGVGGKVEEGETIEVATIRETKEEIGVDAYDLVKVGEIAFSFEHTPDWNQRVHVYFSEKWDGEPAESDEMAPQWYSVDAIPYDVMWPDDIYWIPHVLAGEKINAAFHFGEKDTILKNRVDTVESF